MSIYVISKSIRNKNPARRESVQSVARKALAELLEPLANFVVDAGLSVHDLQALFREAIVRSVRDRQRAASTRINISGIAASTGIPRAEISRILRLPSTSVRSVTARENRATNRILSVWHEDPAYTTQNGQPADLKIYGKGQTFESLVKRFGRGIPVRATLDELVRAGSIELLSRQKVRAKSSVSVDRSVNKRAIKVFGARATELLSNMLTSMRASDRSHFVASIEDDGVAPSELPLLRKEVANKGANFLSEIQDNLFYGPVTRERRAANEAHRVSITIYYHEAPHATKGLSKQSFAARRNFRREP